MRAGLPFSHTVLFSLGAPDAAVSWILKDAEGATLDSDSITPGVGAVSCVINVPGASNDLPSGDLFGTRFLSWSYDVVTVGINDEVQYDLEARVPFNVSPEGVRRKLGVSDVDLPDNEISLIKAYAVFQDAVTGALLTPFEGDGGLDGMLIADAIEARAALTLIPSMPVRMAQSESSGTDQFKRQSVDWDALAGALAAEIAAGAEVVNPDLVVTAGAILLLSFPTDVITGA